jgi:uncharacterized protein with NAD-binding domain and iron-sulfur cluster
MFNKDSGRYLQLVVSASRDLTPLSRSEIIDMAIGDLRLYFPRVRDAQLVKAHVIKEQRATFSAAPETEQLRPTPDCGIPNVYLAGDWTRTGWPATMEGAVRSGYIAAEWVAPNSSCRTLLRAGMGARLKSGFGWCRTLRNRAARKQSRARKQAVSGKIVGAPSARLSSPA